MSLNLPALTGANTIFQLVYDLNQIKVVAANTTSPIFSGVVYVGGSAAYAPSSGLNITGPLGESIVDSVLDELLRITNDGNAGLAIHSGVTGNSSIYFGRPGAGGNSKGKIQYNHASDYLSIDTAGAERARIDSNGNLGLGISPATNHGFTRIIHASGSYSALTLASTSSRTFTIGSGVDSIQIWDTTASAERMRITSAGSLLVGTTTENYPFYFVKSTAGGTPFLAVYNPDNTGGSGIRVVAQTTTPYVGKLTAAAAGGIIQVGAETNHPVVFLQNDTERMRIDSSGNLLLGTSTAVYNTSRQSVPGFTIASNNPGLTLIDTDNANLGWSFSAYNGVLYLASVADNGTHGSDILIINRSSGNIGIGITPSYRLHVADGTLEARFQSTTNGSDTTLTLYSSTAGGTPVSRDLVHDPDADALIFKRSGTEQLRIDSSGNLLIGTSTTGASKLVVADSSIQINTAKTPATASDTGTTGQIAWDSTYFYVCIASNTWHRVAHATW